MNTELEGRDCENPCRTSIWVSSLQSENLVCAEYKTGELPSRLWHSVRHKEKI